jgi:hypothetical protein
MTALEQASELQQQAIQLLLTEREEIDHRLAQLGHGQEKTTTMKRRGRPPKTQSPNTEFPSPDQAAS